MNTDTAACDCCGWYGNKIDPITGMQMLERYKGEMLCSTCRVDQRLADNDYSE